MIAAFFMICQCCGIEAPTKPVTFYQNIGALIMRFSRTIQGNLCKTCIHKNFWQMTGITLVAGWWGLISLIVTPFFLLNNFIRYLCCLGMDPVPPQATPPLLTSEVVARINPQASVLFEQLNAGGDTQAILKEFATICGVTPGQVMLYVQAAMENAARPVPPPIPS